MMAALRRAKLNLVRIHIRVWLYSCFFFMAIMAASLWYMVVADWPIPPAAEKTMGEKEACSISEILWLYALFFSRSCLWYRLEGAVDL